jgi:hypothetical protein
VTTKYSIFFISLFLFLAKPPIVEGFQESSAKPLPKLTVLTSLNYNSENLKQAQAKGVKKVRAFLKKTGIPYEIQIVPWNRAITRAKTQKNILIFEMDRTKDRESLFHWILALRNDHYKLIGLNNAKNRYLTKKEVLNGDFTGICNTGSSACDLLNKFGFLDENILKVSFSKSGFEADILLKKRADFFVSHLGDYPTYPNRSDFTTADFMTLFDSFPTTLYLSAGKNIEPHLLQILKNTAAKNNKQPNLID